MAVPMAVVPVIMVVIMAVVPVVPTTTAIPDSITPVGKSILKAILAVSDAWPVRPIAGTRPIADAGTAGRQLSRAGTGSLAESGKRAGTSTAGTVTETGARGR